MLSEAFFDYYATESDRMAGQRPLARFPLLSSSGVELSASGLKLRQGARVLSLQGPAPLLASWAEALRAALLAAPHTGRPLRVLGLKGPLCELVVEATWRLRDVKAMVRERCGIPAAEQRLVYQMLGWGWFRWVLRVDRMYVYACAYLL